MSQAGSANSVLVEEAAAQPAGTNGLTDHVARHLRRVDIGGDRRWAFGARLALSRAAPSVDAIRLTSSLSWRRRSLLRSDATSDRVLARSTPDVAIASAAARSASSPSITSWIGGPADFAEQHVHEVVRSGHDRGIAPVQNVVADLLQQPVHRRSAVLVKLDPDGGCGCLERNPVRGGVERNDRTDAGAGRLYGASGPLQGGIAVACNENRRCVGIGIAVKLGRIRVHATPGF